MAEKRKLQQEIEKTIKKVDEGIDEFSVIFNKLHEAANPSQKEKYENELKREIKKLQRLRDQIKSWQASSEVKDKAQLEVRRHRIEKEMERFKACEREFKIKAFSKEGLAQQTKLDPQEVEKEKHRKWIREFLERISTTVQSYEAEIVGAKAAKKARQKDSERVSNLTEWVTEHKWHAMKLELVLRRLENDSVEMSQLEDIRDSVELYLDNRESDEGFFDDELYKELNLDDDANPEEGEADNASQRRGVSADWGAEGAPPSGSATATSQQQQPSVGPAPSSSATSGGGSGSPQLKSTVEGQSPTVLTIDSKVEDAVPKTSASEKPTVGRGRAALRSHTSGDTSHHGPTLTPTQSALAGVGRGAARHLQTQSTPEDTSSVVAKKPEVVVETSPSRIISSSAAAAPSSQPPALQNEWKGNRGFHERSSPSGGSPFASQPSATSATSPNASPGTATAVASSGGSATATAATAQAPQLPPPSSTTSPTMRPLGPPTTAAERKISGDEGGPNLSTVSGGPTSSFLEDKDAGRSTAGVDTAEFGPKILSIGVSSSPIADDLNKLQQLSATAAKTLGVIAAPSTPPLQSDQTNYPLPNARNFSGVLNGSVAAKLRLSQLQDVLGEASNWLPGLRDRRHFRYYQTKAPWPNPPAVFPKQPLRNFASPEFFAKLDLETLFFVFYYQQGTYQQYLAAKELKVQSWRFNKKYMTWFQPQEGPRIVTDTFHQGPFVYFDADAGWCSRLKSDLTFDLVQLENELPPLHMPGSATPLATITPPVQHQGVNVQSEGSGLPPLAE